MKKKIVLPEEFVDTDNKIHHPVPQITIPSNSLTPKSKPDPTNNPVLPKYPQSQTPKSVYSSIKAEITEMLINVTAHGVPKMIRTESQLMRLVWLIIILVSLGYSLSSKYLDFQGYWNFKF